MSPTPDVRHARATRRRRRRHLIVTSVLLLLLAGLGLNLRLLLDPEEVRRRARDALETLFIGSVSIESATYRFPNVVVLEGVRVTRAGSGEAASAAIEIPRVRVGFSIVGAMMGRATPKRLTLERPCLRVARRVDGALDVEDLVRPSDPGTPALDLPRIFVRGGRVFFTDTSLLRRGESIEIKDVQLTVSEDGVAVGRGVVAGFGLLEIGANRDDGTVRARLDGIRLETPFSRRFRPDTDVAAALALAQAEGPARLDLAVEQSPDGAAITSVRLSLLGVRIVPVFQDRPTGPSYEFTDVRGDVMLADGRLSVEDMTGRHGPTEFLVRGTVSNLETDPAVDLRVRARNLLVDDEIRSLLGSEARTVFDAYAPWIYGDLTAGFTRAGSDDPVQPDVALSVHGGRMCYHGYRRGPDGKRRGFPLVAENLSGELRLRDRILTILWARATRGPVSVQAGGTVVFIDDTGSTGDVDVSILARDLPIDDDLREALGEKARHVLEPYGVTGRAGKVHIHVTQPGPPPGVVAVTVDLDGRAGICPKAFPLPVRNLRGRVHVGPDPERGPDAERADLLGLVGDGPEGGRVRVDGWIRDWGYPEEEQSIFITLDDASLNPDLDHILAESELSREIVDVWRILAPRGRMDARILLEDSIRGAHSHVWLEPRSVRIAALPEVPYPIPYVRGLIEVCDGVADLHWAIAHAGPTTIAARGRLGPGDEARLDAVIESLPLDTALAKALSTADPEIGKTYDRMRPDPDSHVDLTLEVRAGKEDSFRAIVENPEVVLRPTDGMEIAIGQGRAEIGARTGSIALTDVRGAINGKAFNLSGGTRPNAAPLVTITSDPLRPGIDLRGLLSDGLLDALVGVLEEGRVAADPLRLSWDGPAIRLDGSHFALFRQEGRPAGIAPRGGLTLRTFVVEPQAGRPGVTAFSGQAELTGLDIEAGIPIEELRGLVTLRGTSGRDLRLTGRVRDLTGRLWRRHLTEGTARLGIANGVLRFEELKGILDEGDLTGSVEVRIAEPFAFDTDLTMNNVRLGPFLAPDGGASGPAVKGKLDATLHLKQKGPTLDRLRGKGQVRIRAAELWDIPVFSAIFKALTSAPPIAYRPVFDSADIEFQVRGEVVRIKQMEFRSDFVTLERGAGTVTLFGDVDLTLVPKVRTIDIPGLSDLWSLIKGELVYRVRVQGTLENPSASLEALPFLHGRPEATPRVVPEFLGKIRRKRGLGL